MSLLADAAYAVMSEHMAQKSMAETANAVMSEHFAQQSLAARSPQFRYRYW